MDDDAFEHLREDVRFRIQRGDAKGIPFGSPRNPGLPTLEEFNPRIIEVPAGELVNMIVGRKHGIGKEQAERVSQLSNEDLIGFRYDDPISATQTTTGLSLTGGHHRINEIIQRAQLGQMGAEVVVRILVHD